LRVTQMTYFISAPCVGIAPTFSLYERDITFLNNLDVIYHMLK